MWTEKIKSCLKVSFQKLLPLLGWLPPRPKQTAGESLYPSLALWTVVHSPRSLRFLHGCLAPHLPSLPTCGQSRGLNPQGRRNRFWGIGLCLSCPVPTGRVHTGGTALVLGDCLSEPPFQQSKPLEGRVPSLCYTLLSSLAWTPGFWAPGKEVETHPAQHTSRQLSRFSHSPWIKYHSFLKTTPCLFLLLVTFYVLLAIHLLML